MTFIRDLSPSRATLAVIGLLLFGIMVGGFLHSANSISGPEVASIWTSVVLTLFLAYIYSQQNEILKLQSLIMGGSHTPILSVSDLAFTNEEPESGNALHISDGGEFLSFSVANEGNDIYQLAGFTIGGQIPDKLVWALYELDLHWTGNGGISQSDGSRAVGKRAPELVPDDVERIQQYVDSYTGQYADELEQLTDQLEISTQPKEDPVSEINRLFERNPPINFNAVSEEISKESKLCIQKWLPPTVMDDEDREAYNKHLNGGGHGVPPLEYLSKLVQVPNYESQL